MHLRKARAHIRVYIRVYIRMYVHSCLYVYIHTYRLYTCIHTYRLYTHIQKKTKQISGHVYIHTQIHTYIHIHTPPKTTTASHSARLSAHGPDKQLRRARMHILHILLARCLDDGQNVQRRNLGRLGDFDYPTCSM